MKKFDCKILSGLQKLRKAEWRKVIRIVLFFITMSITQSFALGSYALNNSDAIFNFNQVSQQQRTVSGKVIDAYNQPLPGVTVVVKGTTQGTVTDADGVYSLTNIPEDAILVFSFVGMRTEEVIVGSQTTISITMEEEAIGLEEVIAVGYGTQKKTSMTSAVSTMKAEKIENVSVANVSNALAGRMPGLMTRQTSGELGKDQTDLYIRGISTIGNSAPLIIIDGIPRASLNEIDPSIIESITVLKDAAAVATYGMAGANGVILVTTKSGTKSGKPQFKLSSNIGFQNPTLLQDYANSYEYARAFNEAEDNAGFPLAVRRFSPEDIANFKSSVEGDPNIDQNLYPNQDVWDYVLDNNAPISKTNFSAVGGTEKIQYFTGLSYLYQQANFSTMKLNRFGLDSKIDLTPTEKTTISIGINGSSEIQNGPSASGRDVFIAATGVVPTEPIVWSDGRLAKNGRDIILYDVINKGDRTADQINLLTTLMVEQELFSGFKIKGVFAYDYITVFDKNWTEPPSTYYTINLSTKPYSFEEVESTDKNSLYQAQTTWKEYTGQLIITYDKAFDKHSISMLGVFEPRKTYYTGFWASRSNYQLPIDELDFGSAVKDHQFNGGNSAETSQVGYVYRLSYNYAQKYLFETAGRYDGHYYFAPGKKYGFFPSFSLGWRISEESFMAGMDNIDNLKLRTSWGQSGNLAGGPSQYSSSFVLYSNSYPFGNTPTQGIYAAREGNPNITWEKANKFNVGLDFTLFKGLISGEVDYFNEKRDNMLLSPASTVPEEYGIALAQVNAGKMKNSGIEFLLGGNKRFYNGLNVGITGTYTYAHNELIEIFENPVTANDPLRSRTGHELGAFFGLTADGLYQVSDDKNGDGLITPEDGFPENKLGGILKPGSIKYVDINKDGVIDLTDESKIGYPAIPEIIYSLATDLSWKGFDLNVLFQGAGHTSTYLEGTYVSAFAETRNYPTFLLNNSWTPENPDARFPALSPNGLSQNDSHPYSTFYMLDASYLRLKYAEFGYTIPKGLTDRVGLGAVRVYISGVNLFTWSETVDYKIDPEASTHGGDASGRGWYNPQQRTYTFGINVNF